jgi:hypothetical protein
MSRGEFPDYETGDNTLLVEGKCAFCSVFVATRESTGLFGGGK